ncbi:hypothetical protein FisN_4Lh161 [Fistulifera solaris]|uniref:NAD(P)-binding domain-containing protein n=1 Tax=Fistulifera solaris TaxID=1519565 RepID=A0A1Z5JYY1_FISSO|nr:hypothetical protein FisN_4Lh161 [Fistulifera solaris]|eukprot:GAX19253.1 hypothetical protein FisN_4Lh161 [Fistulifera solaris]
MLHRIVFLVIATFLFNIGSSLKPVLVTGASGRTGRLVFEQLVKDPRFDPKALVRSEKSAQKLRKAIPQTTIDQIVVCDITQLSADNENIASYWQGNSPQIVICTSAVPVISKRSLALAFLKAPFNLLRGKKPIDFRSFRFKWQGGQYPEQVDYKGVINQIELAKKIGVKHIVLVGSMGGTDPSNFLNSVGKDKDGNGNGDILLWKRKAERYLVESGLDYCIIHPGGLTDGPAGVEDFVLDVNDILLERKKRSISRSDVANLCVAALAEGEGKKIALDCITQNVGEEGVTKVRSPEEAFKEFLAENKVYDYEL